MLCKVRPRIRPRPPLHPPPAPGFRPRTTHLPFPGPGFPPHRRPRKNRECDFGVGRKLQLWRYHAGRSRRHEAVGSAEAELKLLQINGVSAITVGLTAEKKSYSYLSPAAVLQFILLFMQPPFAPSAPVQWRLQGPPAKSNFLAV